MKSNVLRMSNMIDLIAAKQLDQNEPEETSCWSLDRQIAQARRDMGPARWAELNKEWNA